MRHRNGLTEPNNVHPGQTKSRKVMETKLKLCALIVFTLAAVLRLEAKGHRERSFDPKGNKGPDGGAITDVNANAKVANSGGGGVTAGAKPAASGGGGVPFSAVCEGGGNGFGGICG